MDLRKFPKKSWLSPAKMFVPMIAKIEVKISSMQNAFRTGTTGTCCQLLLATPSPALPDDESALMRMRNELNI
eukprot:752148-Hanusia_phi.AAC.2